MSGGKIGLDDAYGLETPEDNLTLYEAWAGDYDADFAQASHYEFHLHTARVFAEIGGQGPVLDVGAGTGLLGQALLPHCIAPVDATDLSPAMLEVARGKGVYRDLFAGNVLEGLDIPDGTFAGVVSSGTFTLGHLGPEALPEMIRLLAPCGLAALSVNAAHYHAADFAAALDALSDQIEVIEQVPVRIYAPGAPGDHADDKGLILCFRRKS